MKKFKELYKKLLEDYTEGGSVFNGFADANPRRSAHLDYGTSQMGRGDSISRINAFIHKFLMGNYIDVNAPIIELRSRLNHAGLDFPFDGTRIKLTPGVNTFPLKLYGDVFGQTPTTDLSKGFDRGDNLPNMVMQIDCKYDEESCMWNLSGKIKPGTGATNTEINESIETLNEIAPLLAMLAPLAAKALPMVAKVGTIAARVGSVANAVSGAASTIQSMTKPQSSAAEQEEAIGEYGTKSKKSKGKMCEDGNCGERDMPAPVIGGDGSNYNMGINFGGDQMVATGDPLRQIPMFEQSQEKKDRARALMHFITRKGEIRSRVLMPVFTHLSQKSSKGKLGTDSIKKELYYVVNSASRKSGITLTKSEKDRVVNDLVRNFRKYLKTKNSTKTTKSKKIK